jgi:hypothetical protein
MVHIDLEAQRRAARRQYLKSLRVGSFVRASAPPFGAQLSAGGRMIEAARVDRTAELAAEAEARRKAEDARWFNLSLGPW